VESTTVSRTNWSPLLATLPPAGFSPTHRPRLVGLVDLVVHLASRFVYGFSRLGGRDHQYVLVDLSVLRLLSPRWLEAPATVEEVGSHLREYR